MLARVVEELERWGLLLESDSTLVSVVTLVAGGPVRGSWWGHPKGQEIFQVSRELVRHDDNVLCKLLSGKLTFVHRRLWPALITVGREGADWQLDRLPRGTPRAVLHVEEVGDVMASELPIPRDAYDRKKAVQAIEKNLLAHTYTIHTESGHHEKIIESWDTFAERIGVSRRKRSLSKAMAELEAAADALNEEFNTRAKLPWQ